MDLQEIIKSANNGDVVSMYTLFEYYHDNKQNDLAEHWLYKSADNGYLRAIYTGVAYVALNTTISMMLEAYDYALETYNRGINYLSVLFKKENGVSEEVINELLQKDYYNKFIVGISSCLFLKGDYKSAYELLENEELTDEKKVLMGLALFKMEDDGKTDKTAFSLLKTIMSNKDLKLVDWILAYAYTYLVQGHVHLSLEIVGCSSRKKAIEKAYYLALEASEKDGHTGSIGKDMLSHFRKKFFGGYEYID